MTGNPRHAGQHGIGFDRLSPEHGQIQFGCQWFAIGADRLQCNVERLGREHHRVAGLHVDAVAQHGQVGRRGGTDVFAFDLGLELQHAAGRHRGRVERDLQLAVFVGRL